MLTSHDLFNIRVDTQFIRQSYREVILAVPSPSTGSNYEAFSDAPYDITGSPGTSVTMAWAIYRAQARVRIIQPTTILGLGSVVPGVQVGDYILNFRIEDQGQVERVRLNKDAYMMVDGAPIRPISNTPDSVGQVTGIIVHARRYEPKFRATGL